MYIYYVPITLSDTREHTHKKGHVFVRNLRSFSGIIWNWSPNMEGEEKPKKEADHPDRWAADLLSKRTYLWGLSWLLRDETSTTFLQNPKV